MSRKNFLTTREREIFELLVQNYDTELIEEGYEKIIKYGISFFKKKCRVFKK